MANQENYPPEDGQAWQMLGRAQEITERKQFEESLKAANQHISNILESMSDAFVAFDHQWRYVYVNREAVRLLKRSPEELLGKRWQDVFPAVAQQDADTARGLYRAAAEQITIQLETFSLILDRWIEETIFPTPDGVAICFRDISDRKFAEQRQTVQYAVTRVLAEAETLASAVPAMLQALCESLGWQLGIIWRVSQHRNVLHYVNSWRSPGTNSHGLIDATQSMTFTPGIGLPGRVWSSQKPIWISELSQDGNFSRAPLAAEAGLHSVVGFPIRLGNEILGVIECFSDRVQKPNAALLQLMASIGSQIGQFMERKRTEEALRRREEELRLITNAVPALIAYVDAEQRYRFNNQSYQDWFGRPVAEIYGLHLREVMGESAYEAVRPSVERVLSGEAVSFETQISYSRVGLRYGRVSYIPHLSRQGKVQGFVVLVNDITEYKQIEEDLRDSQERLSLASQAAHIGTFEWNIQTNETVWTEEEETLYGLPPGGFGGRFENWRESVHPDDLDRTEQAILQAVIDCTDLNTEFRIVWPDGSIHWIAAQGRVFCDSNGNPLRMIGVNLDITERKQAEAERERLLQELETERARFEAVLKQMPAGVMIADAASSKLVLTNEQAKQMIGYRYDKSLELEAYESLTPFTAVRSTGQPYTAADYPLMRSLHLGEFVTNEEMELHRSDGNCIFITVNSAPILDQQQQIVAAVAVFQDVTERKQFETERGQLLQQLESSLRQLEAIINRMTEGLIIADAHGNILMFNPTALALHGFDSTEHVRRHLHEFQSLFEGRDLQGNPIPINEWALAKALRGETFSNWEIQIRRLDTGKTWIGSYGGAPIRDQQGQIVLAIVTVHDVSEQRQSQAELARSLAAEQAAREQAEAANRVKDEFLAVLSHELRTPLNPILGWTKLLRTRQFDPPTIERALETIERNAKLQTQLIEDLLDVSRILRGKLVLNTGPVNLVAVIEAALETVQLSAEAKLLHIRTRLNSEVGQVYGDANRLQQVIWNLLSNAIKFTPSGGEVEIRLERVGAFAQIQFRDTGAGVSASFLPYVFDYFRQADGSTTRQFGGLGLGLAIVRHLVELHGGTVHADSPGQGMGATFTVRLPLKSVELETSAEQPPEQLLPNLGGIQVLVVDDEADMRDLVRVILQASGADVRVATSAEHALQLLAQAVPDVLISDIGMPEMDGYALMQHIRTYLQPQESVLPAIALTAYASEMNRQQALSTGFQMHLAKPVEPEKLIAAIVELLKRR